MQRRLFQNYPLRQPLDEVVRKIFPEPAGNIAIYRAGQNIQGRLGGLGQVR